MSDTFLIKGMRETIDRILQAVENQEKIILFGDADPDGVASVIILKEALEILGNPPEFVYFPNREKEGYGINRTALSFLRGKSPAILIALDCGIGNFEEIEIANKMGFEVILIEHHKVLDRLPKASIIVDTEQKDDKYPFKGLCTAGVAYKLAKVMLFEAQKSFEPEKLLELAMIATLSDQMPLVCENQKLIEDGLLSLKYTKRQGLKSLIETCGINDFSENEVKEKIIPPLASASTKDQKNEAYLLLTEKSYEKTDKIAKSLLKKSKLRKERAREIFEEALLKIDDSLPLIFLGEKDWPLTLTGTIASKLYQKYQKPTFVFKKEKIESQGSVRTPREMDSVKAMNFCSGLLETYGGHSQASGFRIKTENLEKFKICLVDYFNRSDISSN